MSQQLKSILQHVVLLLMVTTLAACSNISIQNDWDRNVDFSKFKTFTVLQNDNPSLNRLVDQRIMSALVADLKAKGFKQVESKSKADLAFGYTVTTEQRTTYQTVHTNIGASHGFRQHWYWKPGGVAVRYNSE